MMSCSNKSSFSYKCILMTLYATQFLVSYRCGFNQEIEFEKSNWHFVITTSCYMKYKLHHPQATPLLTTT